ncbi:T9SS type A sorting domain-containing protein [Maribacter sp. 2210JD10-5]|uniref:T9SS type A sorting domain-containing protein n=1 Tax=Maribacter sp. 2210JD10-5 TaxID=3386272 RepID=UPI0039BD1CFD
MKKSLLKKNFMLFFVFGLLLTFSVQAQKQNLKTTADNGPKKGHALYKKTKIYDSKSGPVGAKPKAVGDRALDRWEYEHSLLKNPYTNKIPNDILLKETQFSEKIKTTNLSREASKQFEGKTSRRRFSYFGQRGPDNVGGRTRALAIDRNNENVILAGGVSGGLWRSENTGQSWRRVTRIQQSPSITAIVQDPRPNRGNIWYYASGERFGNSAGAGGAFYQGSGIYQSYNGGRSWNQLRSTDDGDDAAFSSFDLINSLAVDPRNGDLYAATFDGLYRSQNLNGARTFEQVLDSGFDRTTEVMITPEGKIYVTVDSRSANGGFFVSEDGEEFTNISPPVEEPSFGRTVMAYDPSNENRIYFFSSDLSGAAPALLWRYQADTETEEERWADLSANLPINIGGPIGSLDLQGSYNMIIKVHPTDPDLVYLGGTNLYRSTTGFTTPTGAEGWIGGYNIANDVSLYPNHHPDQHNLVFFPSNPNKAVSGNDGGVQITEDITRITPELNIEDVEWTSLNNGYVTTQPYVIAIDPEPNSDDIVAGFQDNGTWFSNSTDPTAPWISDFGGDGSFNAIADGGRTRYVSAQRGVVFRFNFDEDGSFVSFTRVQPSGASGFGFIAPFILDPTNDNIMYMPAGDRIWRNNDLDEIPLFSNANTSVNWVEQTQTATPDGSNITALDASRFPVANTLYYGTNSGGIYKVENANIDDQEVIDLSSGKGLPPGFVNDIYVDPNNSERVFVVFSNYSIPSLFMSENGGESWVNISGNLEENPDGSGNGPSVRSFAISGNNNIFFAGTSTGLYITYNLNGERTRWFKERGVIGDAVVMDVKTRKDGYMALATHGNGVFDAAFYAAPSPEPSLSVAYLLDDVSFPINSGAFEFDVDVTGLFVSDNNANISIEVTNTNPELVSAVLEGNTLRVSGVASELEENATIGLVATSGNEQVTEGFTVRVVVPAIYEQTDPSVSSTPSQFFLDFGALAQTADDFIVPEGNSWKVRSIIANGVANGTPTFSSATVVVYTDNGGVPGQPIFNSGELVPVSDPQNTNIELEFPEDLELESGTYWLSVYANLAFNPNQEQWFWLTQANVIGSESAFRDDGLFVAGGVDWTPRSLVFGNAPDDLVFQIFGTILDGSEEDAPPAESNDTPILDAVSENQTLTEIGSTGITTVWPNPSTAEFYFSLKESKDAKVTARVYNILGQMVYEKGDIDATKTFSWNSSGRPTGLYFVKIQGANTNQNFGIIKK